MRYEINSSSIAAVEETGRGTLIIEFVNRGKYEYFGVPPEVIQGLVGSTSAGRFFNENIRDEYRNEPRT